MVEGLFGSQLPEHIHEGVVAVATIFTYGILFLSPLSYAFFKHIVLPVLNWLPGKLKNRSYFLNSTVVLVVMEVILVCVFAILLNAKGKNIHWLNLIVGASIPTAFVAINCFGHICIFKLRSRRGTDA